MAKVVKKVKKGVKPGKPAKKEKEPRRTIISFVRECFDEDPSISTTDLIEKVSKEFPSSAFDKAHAAFYRNKLREEGVEIPLIYKDKAEEEKPSKKTSKGAKSSKKVVKVKKKVKPAADEDDAEDDAGSDE